MRAKQAETVLVDGREVKITRPDKILFREDGITKGDLIRYYQRIGLRMLPYLEGRPLSMQRFPDGIDQPGFFQKAAARYYPEWIQRATVRKAGGTVTHVVCGDLATLVYLANQACVTMHTWLSRIDRPESPDQMIFDLDPSTGELAPVIDAARAIRAVLDDLELPAFLKTTGGRGLHIVVPLDRQHDFEAVRGFARRVAQVVVDRDPARYTLEQYKSKRQDRVFLDINRNAYAQTAVAVYSVRPRKGAPVSAPLAWSELETEGFRPDGVNLLTAMERLERIEDPWKDFGRRAGSLDQAARHLR